MAFHERGRAYEGSSFTARETHGRVLRPDNRLILHSQDAGWRSLHAATFQEAPFSAREPAIGHPSLIYHLSRPTEVTRRVEGAPRERALIGPRRLCLTPGNATTEWQHNGRPEILQVYLRQSVYERTVQDMYGCDETAAALTPQFAMLDPLLEQLVIAILGALQDGTADDGLYVDMVAQMIAAHLARTYSTRARSVRFPTNARLSTRRIRRLVDYIETHLGDDLSLDALAAEAGLSPLYLARAFKTGVGQSPHRYVVERRVERAKDLLRRTDTSIVDVALATGFSSQSHLSAWFLRLVGVTPAAYRRG